MQADNRNTPPGLPSPQTLAYQREKDARQRLEGRAAPPPQDSARPWYETSSERGHHLATWVTENAKRATEATAPHNLISLKEARVKFGSTVETPTREADHEPESLKNASDAELARLILTGRVAYTGGGPNYHGKDLDFAKELAKGNIHRENLRPKKWYDPEFYKPTISGPQPATAQRTLPVLPEPRPADGAKQAAQRAMRAPEAKKAASRPPKRVVSTFGAFVDAAKGSPELGPDDNAKQTADQHQKSPADGDISPAPSSPEIFESTKRTGDKALRRGTVIVNAELHSMHGSIAGASLGPAPTAFNSAWSDSSEEENKSFDFSRCSSSTSVVGQDTPQYTEEENKEEARRLAAIDLEGRLTSADKEDDNRVTVDTFVRDGHTSWVVTNVVDKNTVESFHTRQERQDNQRPPKDEAAALMERLEIAQRTGESIRKPRAGRRP